MQEVTNRKNEALQPAVPDTDQRLVHPGTTEPRHENQGLGRCQVVGGMLLNTQSSAGQSHGSFPTHPYPQCRQITTFPEARTGYFGESLCFRKDCDMATIFWRRYGKVLWWETILIINRISDSLLHSAPLNRSKENSLLEKGNSHTQARPIYSYNRIHF